MPPVVTKAFTPSTVVSGGTSTLSFSITNPNPSGGASVTSVQFTDVLQTGLGVTFSPTFSAGCPTATTISYTLATNTITISTPSNAGLPPGANCTVSVPVTAPGSPTLVNNTTSVISSSTGAAPAAVATLTVTATPPTLTKQFGATSIGLNDTTTLTFVVTNPNAAFALSGIAFTDSLPAGLRVATPNGLATTCGSGTFTAVAGGSSVSVNGLNLAGGTSCTVVLNVTGVLAGTQVNTTGPISSTQTGAGGTATATLAVVLQPTISKQFGAIAIPLEGTTTLQFTITNPNASASLTNISVSDTLPAGLRVATPNGATGTCLPGATVAAVAGGNTINISGLTLAGGASCTVSVNVFGAAEGMQNNTTGPISSTQSGAGGVASASLFVGPVHQISYAANLTSGDSAINLTNTGANGASLFGPGFGGAAGNICVNVYAFSPDEQLVSCCSCLITPNGGASLSVVSDLISNTLTGVRPSSITIKLIGTATGAVDGQPTFTGANCSNSAASPLPLASGLSAWRTTLHAAPVAGTFAMTEVPFIEANLSSADLDSIRNRCRNIIGNGSTFGICRSCRAGTLGAVPNLK